jgi:hypothetical protein
MRTINLTLAVTAVIVEALKMIHTFPFYVGSEIGGI